MEPVDGLLLKVDDLHVEFRTRDGVAKAINGTSFTLSERETLAILGESGSGKSVTAQAIMGILESPPAQITGGGVGYCGGGLLTVAGTLATHNLAVGVVLGVVAASIGFARRVAHLVEVELVDGYTYVVHGQLFFASSNDLVYAFDYTLDTDFVVVDLSDAEVWDASTVATLDAVQKKYADRGIEVEFRGLDGASAQRLERLSGQLGD